MLHSKPSTENARPNHPDFLPQLWGATPHLTITNAIINLPHATSPSTPQDHPFTTQRKSESFKIPVTWVTAELINPPQPHNALIVGIVPTHPPLSASTTTAAMSNNSKSAPVPAGLFNPLPPTGTTPPAAVPATTTTTNTTSSSATSTNANTNATAINVPGFGTYSLAELQKYLPSAFQNNTSTTGPPTVNNSVTNTVNNSVTTGVSPESLSAATSTSLQPQSSSSVQSISSITEERRKANLADLHAQEKFINEGAGHHQPFGVYISLHATLGVANNAGVIITDQDAKAVVKHILHAANKTNTVAITIIHNQRTASLANNTSYTAHKSPGHEKWIVQLCPTNQVNPAQGTVFPTATIAELTTSIEPFITKEQAHRHLPSSPPVAKYFTANVSQLNSPTSQVSFFLVSAQNDSLPMNDAFAAQQLTFLIYNAIRAQLGTNNNGQHYLPKYASPASLARFFGLRHFKYNNNNSPPNKRNNNRSTNRYIIVGIRSACERGRHIESVIHSFLLVNKDGTSQLRPFEIYPGSVIMYAHPFSSGDPPTVISDCFTTLQRQRQEYMWIIVHGLNHLIFDNPTQPTTNPSNNQSLTIPQLLQQLVFDGNLIGTIPIFHGNTPGTISVQFIVTPSLLSKQLAGQPQTLRQRIITAIPGLAAPYHSAPAAPSPTVVPPSTFKSRSLIGATPGLAPSSRPNYSMQHNKITSETLFTATGKVYAVYGKPGSPIGLYTTWSGNGNAQDASHGSGRNCKKFNSIHEATTFLEGQNPEWSPLQSSPTYNPPSAVSTTMSSISSSASTISTATPNAHLFATPAAAKPLSWMNAASTTRVTTQQPPFNHNFQPSIFNHSNPLSNTPNPSLFSDDYKFPKPTATTLTQSPLPNIQPLPPKTAPINLSNKRTNTDRSPIRQPQPANNSNTTKQATLHEEANHTSPPRKVTKQHPTSTETAPASFFPSTTVINDAITVGFPITTTMTDITSILSAHNPLQPKSIATFPNVKNQNEQQVVITYNSQQDVGEVIRIIMTKPIPHTTSDPTPCPAKFQSPFPTVLRDALDPIDDEFYERPNSCIIATCPFNKNNNNIPFSSYDAEQLHMQCFH
jgi:hypothetical protein